MRQWYSGLNVVSVSGIIVAMFAVTTVSANNSVQPLNDAAIPSPKVASSLLLDITRAGRRLIAVGEQGHIIYSDDDGQQWQHAEVPVSLMLTAVDFPSEQRGWAVGHDGIILASVDQGSSWQIQLDGREIAALQLEAAQARLAVLESESQTAESQSIQQQDALDDALFDLEDIEQLQVDGIMNPLLGVTFKSDVNGFAYGAYGLLLVTSDGGKTWLLRSDQLDNEDNFHLYDLVASPTGSLFLTGEAGSLFRSQDMGNHWERLAINYTGSLFGVVATQDRSVVTFGLRGKIFRSDDDGVSWQALESVNQKTLMGGKSLGDKHVVLVGASGSILMSTDNGRSFMPIESGTREVLTSPTTNAADELLVSGFGGVRTLSNSPLK